MLIYVDIWLMFFSCMMYVGDAIHKRWLACLKIGDAVFFADLVDNIMTIQGFSASKHIIRNPRSWFPNGFRSAGVPTAAIFPEAARSIVLRFPYGSLWFPVRCRRFPNQFKVVEKVCVKLRSLLPQTVPQFAGRFLGMMDCDFQSSSITNEVSHP